MKKVTINNENIAYEEIGTGTPILFIHPPGMGRKVFYEQKPLSKDFRLILPDLVGTGDSSYYGGYDISIKQFGEDLIQFLDHLQIKTAIIFGYSSGGTIAQYLAIHHPERVQALIISGGFPVVDNFILINEHRLGILTVERNQKFLSKVLAYSHTKDKTFQEILKDHMYKSSKKVWGKFYFESLHFDCREELKRNPVPTLLLYGSRSDAMNTYIKYYQDNLPNKEIHVIKGATHQLPTREPEKINPIIQTFLSNL